MMMPTLAERFEGMVPSFRAGPAPLYESLAREAAHELATGSGDFYDVLAPYAEEPPRLLLPLRLFAIVHRWVLGGEAVALSRYYPSSGGRLLPDGAWMFFRDLVITRRRDVVCELRRQHQHNEPSRAGALLVGLMMAGWSGLPIRLVEVGSSAGLLLRMDHYRALPWFRPLFDGPPPHMPAAPIVSRRGCDLDPIDPTLPGNQLRLRSMVWADLHEHQRILDDALRIAEEIPATVVKADGAEFLSTELAQPHPGQATVVFHSLMTGSGPQASLPVITSRIEDAGQRADMRAPLYYLRFETPAEYTDQTDRTELVEVRLTVYRGGAPEDVLIATSDVNGRNVRMRLAVT